MHKQTAMSDAPLLMPVRQAARKIGVAAKTIRRYPHDFFEVLQLGSHGYVRRADYMAFIERVLDTGSGQVLSDNGRAEGA